MIHEWAHRTFKELSLRAQDCAWEPAASSPCKYSHAESPPVCFGARLFLSRSSYVLLSYSSMSSELSAQVRKYDVASAPSRVLLHQHICALRHALAGFPLEILISLSQVVPSQVVWIRFRCPNSVAIDLPPLRNIAPGNDRHT
jgi:hypothetical protein